VGKKKNKEGRVVRFGFCGYCLYGRRQMRWLVRRKRGG